MAHQINNSLFRIHLQEETSTMFAKMKRIVSLMLCNNLAHWPSRESRAYLGNSATTLTLSTTSIPRRFRFYVYTVELIRVSDSTVHGQISIAMSAKNLEKNKWNMGTIVELATDKRHGLFVQRVFRHVIYSKVNFSIISHAFCPFDLERLIKKLVKISWPGN